MDLDGFPRAPRANPQPALALVACNGTGDAAADQAYADAVAKLLADAVAKLLADSGAGGTA